ncbi:hypothetical protein M8494_06985 [Serratia ureilytica]
MLEIKALNGIAHVSWQGGYAGAEPDAAAQRQRSGAGRRSCHRGTTRRALPTATGCRSRWRTKSSSA